MFSAADAPLLERAESLGADDEAEDDDDDEDEIVFGAAAAAAPAHAQRRHSAQQAVDPDAPTPVVPQRTERRFHSSSTRPEERTPPAPGVSYATQAAFLSPSYQVDGQGLLDDY